MILSSMRDFVCASVWVCVDGWVEGKGCAVCVCIVVASVCHGHCVCGFVLFVDIIIGCVLGSSAVACVTACCV